jgi:tripartite-type tricarboxylate transporter receptor subunit TctC
VRHSQRTQQIDKVAHQPLWETSVRLPRRKLLHLAAAAAALPAIMRTARAQAYPKRPVRIVVPFPAGGQIDITGRVIAQWLSERLGQQFFVDNRPGAAANIGTEAVVRSAADGHTLLMATVANAVNATLFEKLSYDFIRDTVPIASVNRIPLVLEANSSFPSKTVSELIANARANPGKINIATPPREQRHLWPLNCSR